MGQQQSTKKPLKRATSFSVAKSKLSRIELVSLKYTFRDLKTSLSDHFECIEAKEFLEHLNLPSELETAGVLLYKAFSYLGDYPNLKEAVPLSLESFVTSFVVLIGRYDDEPDHITSDELFFQALSILPDQNKEQQPEQQQVEQSQQPQQQQQQSTEVSLEDLDFNAYLDQLDPNKQTNQANDPQQQQQDEEGQKNVLKHDLIQVLLLLLWLGTKGDTAMEQLKQTATKMVSSMSRNNNNNKNFVTWNEFCAWKKRFAPHLFKPFKSFLLKTFGFYHTGDKEERLLVEDTVPVPDTSDILTPLYTTLVAWALPEKYTQVKSWQRLYSSDEDGFSMNRFETHVFKYPGPTIALFQIDISSSSSSSSLFSKQDTDTTNTRKVVGAFITEPWKQSRHSCWGSDQCFLFELDPELDIYRTVVGKNDHYIYYHHDFGIGFGGTRSTHTNKDEQFILKIENTLQQGTYANERYPSSPTFKGWHERSFEHRFDIITVEVFGLGTERDKQRQEKEWLFDQKEAQRRAGLNIRQSDGALDKELLKMAGIIDMDNRQDR